MRKTNEALDLDYNLLLVLSALLSERSTTAAGVKLGVTQSAISHSLKRLRETFNDPLFIKSRHGMTPTDKANALASAVDEIILITQTKILSQIAFDPQNVRRMVSLCMSDMASFLFLPDLYSKLKSDAPLCGLKSAHIPPAQLEQHLATGQADLALGSDRYAADDLYQQKIRTDRYIAVVSCSNSLSQADLTVQAFCAMPHIVLDLGDKTRAPYERYLDEAGIERNIALSTSSFLSIPALIRAHPELIAMVPEPLATAFAQQGLARKLEAPVPMPSFTFFQYWHPRFHHDPVSIWLRTLVRSCLGER